MFAESVARAEIPKPEVKAKMGYMAFFPSLKFLVINGMLTMQ